MRVRNLADLLKLLRERGELRSVDVAVARELELAEVVARAARRGRPAIQFERPAESALPIAANLYGSPRRLALALGVDRLEALTAQVERLVALWQGGGPSTLGDRVRLAGQMHALAGLGPRVVRQGPCQEVVNTGAPTLDPLPAVTVGGDGCPTLGLASALVRDPSTGESALGLCAVHVHDHRAARLGFAAGDPAGAVIARAARKGRRVPVALAFGGDPAVLAAAAVVLPLPVDRLALAAFLRGAQQPVVRCRTIPCAAPAEAEFVLEGWVEPEAPADASAPSHGAAVVPAGAAAGRPPLVTPGCDDPGAAQPVLRLSALTHRYRPCLPLVLPAPLTDETAVFAQAALRLALPLVRLMLPDVVDLAALGGAGGLDIVVAALRNADRASVRRAIFGLWGLAPFAGAKVVVIVDADAPLDDGHELLRRVAAHADPGLDLIRVDGEQAGIELGPGRPASGAKLGVDATCKPRDGRGRAHALGQDEAAEAIRRLVESRWSEYGLP